MSSCEETADFAIHTCFADQNEKDTQKKGKLSWTHETGHCDEEVKVLVQLIAHYEMVLGIKKKSKN